ncbi:MAG: hypothetical protein MRY57_03245 [Candidatus Pacebacteria bacterium]|nr:hypothetical protein [Candidatus Paceibacterota bacterium]
MKDDITPKKPDERIEKLERDLYDPNKDHGQRDRRKIHDRKIELEKDFTDDEYERLLKERSKYNLPTSLFKKIFFAVLIFFFATLAVAGVTLYEGQTTVSEELIALEILGQPFVDGGEELELQVRVQNFNEQALQLPDLVISYPKDSGVDAERVFLRRSLQDIDPQGRVTEEFDATLFGQEGDIREIEATLEYRIEGSSSIFVKQGTHQVIIRSTPTQISVIAPDTIVRNQDVALRVDVSSNSNQQINDTLLKIDYPRGFEYVSSSLLPNFNNNTWYFDNIGDDVQSIEIIGRLAALEGQGQSFNFEYGKQNQFNKNEFETVFNSIIHTIDVQKSFIESSIVVNSDASDQSSIRGGDDLDIRINYKNTLETDLRNVVLTVNLDGDLYDPSQVNLQNGFYNSSNQTIVFDQTTNERLALLEPGEEGDFRFTIGGKELVGASGVLSNPFAEITVDVEGTASNGQKEEAFAVARHRVLANSDISVIPKTLYYEGPFRNQGPMPPKVNETTTYTMVFEITNSSNAVSGAELSTFLPPYVEWLNVIAPSVERTNVSFDNTTRELVWRLGDLRSGLGVGTSQPRQVSLQIRVTPSITQLDEDFALTGDIILSGEDTFTETELNFRKTPLFNRLENRRAVGADGRVVQ